MTRLLTADAQTESARQDGAELVRVLEIQWGGSIGTRYYSDIPLYGDLVDPLNPDPVLAEPRVLDWGTIDLQAEPGTVGGHGAVTLSLADPDHVFDSLFKTKPGIQNKLVYIHLYYRGTVWPDDRVTLFGGIVGSPSKWDEKRAAWSLSLKGAETFFDRTIGQLLTRQAFPELQCSECEGDSFPIVYGDPVFRVPCCPIDRPGKGMLGHVVEPYDDYLYLAASAETYGFTLYDTITIVVGYGGNSETLTGGFFNPADLTQFTIYTRTSLQSSGVLGSVVSDGGFQYGTVPESNFINPTASRMGYLIYFRVGVVDPVWVGMTITDWIDQGATRAAFLKGDLALQAGGGEKYVVSAIPSTWVVWSAGVPVYEVGPWTYCVNFLPSHEIIRVEARSAVSTPSGDTQSVWSEYNGVYWEYNLDNRTWNERLNRTPFQVGITTVTLDSSPTDLGFTDPKIYVTLRGCTEDNDWASPAMSNAGKIIRHLLITRQLGDIPGQFIDETSFASAMSQVQTYMAFALMTPKKLNELCGDLAFQAGMLYFWDQGKACLQKLRTTLLSENNALTITPSNYATQTLEWTEASITDFNTQMSAKFKLSVPSNEQKLFRESREAITAYGKRMKELDLWAYQYPTSVALTTEFWLEFWLENQRTVTFDTYLCGVHLRPGDTINIGIDDARTGDPIYANQLARVNKVHHTLANPANQQMERLTITADVKLWDWTIDVSIPPNGACEAPVEGTTSTTSPPPTTTTTTSTTSSTTTTTTEGPTTTSSPTTTLFPPTTTTTTTTTAVPTTTPGPDCFGSCTYTWSGAAWSTSQVCTGTSCECPAPTSPGVFIGQESVSYCALPTTTSTTSTTTTTTTTAAPAGACCIAGVCSSATQIACEGAGGAWYGPGSVCGTPPTGVDCSTPTTTSTTTTAVPTTTTTSGPCSSQTCIFTWLENPVGGGTFRWSPGGGSCSTPCDCTLPTGFGSYSGQVQYTDCISGTTTTTTTTAPPCSSHSCTWVWAWTGTSYIWLQSGTACTSPCTCSTPTASGSYESQTTTTACNEPTTTTTTSGPTTTTTTTGGPTTTAEPCTGYCLYIWIDSGNGSGSWGLGSSNCGGAGCWCPAPVGNGSYPGEMVTVYCIAPTTTTTSSTTTTSTPTTTTTTTTVAPTTTTTTAAPCSGDCNYWWDGAVWVPSYSDCNCPCHPPAAPGTGYGEPGFGTCGP
jgi:hypothetical protein